MAVFFKMLELNGDVKGVQTWFASRGHFRQEIFGGVEAHGLVQ